jgi:hypothetical protein
MQNTRIFSGVIAKIECLNPLLSIVRLGDIYDRADRGFINIMVYSYVPRLYEGRAVDIIETSFISQRTCREEALEQQIKTADISLTTRVSADLRDRILAGKVFKTSK